MKQKIQFISNSNNNITDDFIISDINPNTKLFFPTLIDD